MTAFELPAIEPTEVRGKKQAGGRRVCFACVRALITLAKMRKCVYDVKVRLLLEQAECASKTAKGVVRREQLYVSE